MPQTSAKIRRCPWAGDDPQMIAYHDREWGRPVHDDVRLFEFILLEGAQAGLSWQTILAKREAYRDAFAGFDPRRVARFDSRVMTRLLANEGIVRNQLKIESAVRNARALLEIQDSAGSFDAFVWRFVGGKPIDNMRRRRADLPDRTPESDALSKALIEAGFNFVGPTICYAFMQAVGMVNDHLTTCDFRGSRRPRSR
jgi:DNA-3-methyladenine glycosylase I